MMTDESVEYANHSSDSGAKSNVSEYDPFVRGKFPVGVRTIEALDTTRNRLFPCEIWYPADAQYAGQDLAPATQDTFAVPSRDTSRSQMAVRDAMPLPGSHPLILFSHGSGVWNRRAATFICTHLASHGYVVSGLDHSETIASELIPKSGETTEQRASRIEALIGNRVPDIRFLLDHLLNSAVLDSEVSLDSTKIGIVGHSFGGWTALAAIDAEPHIQAVVALAPGGSSQPRPGILPATLDFAWGRDVPALYLVAENDTMTPVAGMHELFERTPATKQMVILRRADHLHFMDNVEQEHESIRAMSFTGELAWIPKEMRPIGELCSGQQAQMFVRGLILCHMDAILRQQEDAQQFLLGDLEAELAMRGADIVAISE